MTQSKISPRDICAVVFDLDGLMFNTEDVFNATGQELLGRRGLEFTHEIRVQMMGRRANESFAILREMTGLPESADDLLAESQQIFEGLLSQHLAPMPGLFDLLNHIEHHALPKGVATSSGRAYLENILGRFDLLSRFPMTLAAEDVSQGKPHPEIYLKAAERIGVSPMQMLVFEDSEAGTQAAVAANAPVISIPHEHSRQHDFRGAAFIATGLNDPRIREWISG